MRTLYQFPLSHFCEKARWLLDHKELDFVAHNLAPGFHRAFARLKTGQNNLPILKDETHWIADSTEIARYLDETYPEHNLLPSRFGLREEVLHLNHEANLLGVHVRHWVWSQMIVRNNASLDILLGESGYLRKLKKYSQPLVKTLVSHGFQLDAERLAESKQYILTYAEKFTAQPQYLLAERLTLADIAVCSMLAPLLNIAGTPWELDSFDMISEEAYAFSLQLQNLPIGQYVMRIYATERNARVDWHGI
ncbi:glutathione S-transferase family protein [Acinetobacter sp. ANC 4641]|uniref:glutathione S-transferase family protein n=1 Tax=Acinetobacter sp. ANC 4641 TaxID=2529847 RepID=UPI00103C9FCD|nr:glutathione S-transferase family protein [Acinetobacter sp. ANC 4641]TCB06396.1 glutathione S-transferase family protein [Acinetobacter sp. ANC 4641]